MIIDHPRLRRTATCPICSGGKDVGCVWCWECHRIIQAGPDSMRAIGEAALDAAEATLTEYAETD